MVIRELDANTDAKLAYERFVETSPQGMIYCRSWWLDAVAPNQYKILVGRQGDEMRAAWPITYQDVEGQRIIGMPPLTQKLGILFAPSSAKHVERLSQEHRIIEEFIQQLASNTYFVQHFHENFTNWLPFYWNDFQQTTRYTYLIPDLTDLNGVWASMRKVARSSIRGGVKSGLHVRETQVGEVFRLYTLTMNRQGLRVPYTQEQLERLDLACSVNAGRLALIAEDGQGRRHAGLYLVHDSRCAIYLLAGADPDLRASGAQTVLLWEAIQFAGGVSRIFDFEGSMIRGVEAAIRDLGGVQTPYFKIWREAKREGPTRPVNDVRRLIGRGLRRLAQLADPK